MGSRLVAVVSLAVLLSACGGASIDGTIPSGDESPITQESGSDGGSATSAAVSVDETTTTARTASPDASSGSEGADTDSDGTTDDSSISATTTSTTSPVRAGTVPSSTVPAPAMTGEVPDDLMRRVLADAADRTGVEVSAMTEIRSEAVVWNDGSLGCPQPGMLYTQEIIDGYWVELAAGELILDYRINASGAFFICESDGPRP